MAIFCKEWYLINTADAGTAVADAHFITDTTAKAQERYFGNKSVGYPAIHAALGVECLAAGIQVPGKGYAELTLLNGPTNIDANYDRWIFPIEWYGTVGDITAGDLQYIRNGIENQRFNEHTLNMPYPRGSTLADGTVSKVYGSAANTYTAFVLYQLAGPTAPPPRGGMQHIVTYDKGGDSTTVVWNTFENAAQNAAGELKPNHMYRLLWGAMDAQAANDTEALIARVTVPGYPALMFPGAGGYYNEIGFRRIWFLDDSIEMAGDSVHKVEGHIGTACRPLIHLCWEDMGAIR